MTQATNPKIDLSEITVPDARLEELLRLFPEAVTEGKIDFARLRQTLGDAVDPRKEKYGLSWAGKSEAIQVLQTSATGTLVPMPEESVNFESSENLIIEGDNLEVLKLLQKSYYGKVKMIYIDPPYNTGNEFIYPDNFKEGLEEYLKYSGQTSEDGLKLSTNTEGNGRYHSKWLSMMYPRIFLAKNLLRQDGVIFASIDDNEVHNLRCLMNEIFGEENFVAELVWKNSSRSNDLVAVEHEYILCYAKVKSMLAAKKWRSIRPEAQDLLGAVSAAKNAGKTLEDAKKELGNRISFYMNKDKQEDTKKHSWIQNYASLDENFRIYYAVDLSGEGSGPPRKFGDKVVPAPEGRHWMSQEYIDDLYSEGSIVWRGERAYRKLYIEESEEGFKGILEFPTRRGSEYLKTLMGKDIFDKPKPHDLIKHLVKYASTGDDIVLDFFAGSGTSGHAVIEMNQEDDSKRRFILVQLPESIDSEAPAYKAGYRKISDICRDRIKKVIQKIANPAPHYSFKFFKLSSSNFKEWRQEDNNTGDEAFAQQLRLHIENVKEQRGALDIVYEIALKLGYELSVAIETVTLAKQPVYSIAGGEFMLCVEKTITPETLREMMKRKPKRIMCLDVAFEGNDTLKTNIVLEMQSHSIAFHTA